MSAVLTMLSPGEAQRLTQRIKMTASSVRDGLFKLRNLVEEARESNVWQVLGFQSWTAYLADTLADEPMRLDRDERQALVGYLAGEGLSTRAIAPIVGVAHKTVARDIEAAVSNDTPDPGATPAPAPAVAGPDASPTHERTATVNLDTGELTEEPAPAPIIGLDGKKYKRPEPKPVPAGDTAEVITAENESRAIGRALAAMHGMSNPAHRERVISRWWPLGNDAVPPDARALFEPRALRDIATHIMQLADELEDSL